VPVVQRAFCRGITPEDPSDQLSFIHAAPRFMPSGSPFL
jgi:hypothetical protein